MKYVTSGWKLWPWYKKCDQFMKNVIKIGKYDQDI